MTDRRSWRSESGDRPEDTEPLREDLPGLLAGELPPGRADELARALGDDDGLRRDLAEVAWAANALRDAARVRLPDPAELPALALPPEAGEPAVPAVLLVATDDGADPAYRGARLAAMELARRRRAPASLVLYDRSPELYLVDPYAPAAPAAPGALLDETAARRAGRPYLAEQLREAGGRGLSAGAWVARGPAGTALAACLAAVGADELVLPAALASPRLVDRVRGHTAGAFVAAMTGRGPARIHLADEQGHLLGL